MLRLRKVLDTKGISVKGCADILGITEKTMRNKLGEETEFTYGEVRKLKTMLPEYDIDYLLSRDETAA